MAKGDGSITEIKKPDGRSYAPKHWRVCVSLGTDPITGKRTKAQRNVIGTKSEACKVRDQLKDEHERGLAASGDRMTFGEFADSWHEDRKVNRKVGSTRLKREASIIEDLRPYLGDTRLRDITPQVVESLYTRFRKDKEARWGHFSGTSMNMTHKLLKQILGKAVSYDLILRNPCDKVEAPKCDTVERRSLTAEEGRRFLAKVDEAEERAYEALDAQFRPDDGRPRTRLRGASTLGNVIGVRVALATGMRRGEVVGLTWGDVYLDRRQIRVRHAYTEDKEVKAPKSEAGARLINIDAETADHLRRWKARQASELALICVEQSDETPVCCNDKGDHMDVHNYSRFWRGFADEAGFPGLRLHELRHTQATQLIGAGMDIKTVQHRLGHASASLTMNLYAHALPQNDEAAADLIGSLFSSKPTEASEGRKKKSA